MTKSDQAASPALARLLREDIVATYDSDLSNGEE